MPPATARTYASYDARGHVGRKVDGPNDLTFTYDRAERVTQIRETGGSQRVLKAFTYGTSNASGVWDNGKVKTAKRYNYAIIGGAFDPQVTETYFYAGRHGRASKRDTLVTVAGPTWGSFTQSWTYNDLGQLASIGYPDCTFSPCSTQVPDPEGASFTYTNGFLSGVPNHANSITYHSNAMVNQVSHFNGVVDTFANDPNGMGRPASIQATYSGNPRWSSGTYQYDGTGSVSKIGNAPYLYDVCERLVSGRVFTGSTGGGTQLDQGYVYDPFGNIQAITGSSGRNTPTSPSTNRLNDPNAGITYDTAGNLTSWNGNTYAYDAFNQMSRMTSGSEDWYYFYTAGDERIWMYKPSGTNPKRFTLRGLDNRVLATYLEESTVWSRERQNIYRDGTLLAAKHASNVWSRIHVDHLGTPRSITESFGNPVAYHAYYAFGEEATSFSQDEERMKFTGHERDLASTAGADDDLDYMHARHFNPLTGRLLSTDRAGGSMFRPQGWNRYVYGADSPLSYLDSDGNAVSGFTGFGNEPGGITALVSRLNQSPIGPAQAFRHQDNRAGAFFLRDQYLNNPGNPLVLLGHSLGAVAAVQAAGLLRHLGIPIDLLFTIDPASSLPVSSNVAVAYNYHTGLPFGYTLRPADPSTQSTQVTNVQMLGIGHTALDDYLAGSDAVANQIISLAQQQAAQRRANQTLSDLQGASACFAFGSCGSGIGLYFPSVFSYLF